MTVQPPSERQRTILALVVREYIEDAAPVGSKGLSERYGLGVSSATIRNELASLEDLGFLTHPHTSAGRVPTERGYRYFVETLMQQVSLAPAEQLTIRHQFFQSGMELDQLMRLSAAVLSNSAQAAAVVLPPRVATSRFKHVELIMLRESVSLLILVLQGGLVRQQVIAQSEPLTQEMASTAASRLNAACAGLTSDQLPVGLETPGSLSDRVVEMVREMMRQVDAQSSDDVYRDGLGYIMELPEFREVQNLRQLVENLERGKFFQGVLGQMTQSQGVQVIIGGEGRWDELSECSVVLARYGALGHVEGALGVVGPMRMRYGHTISLVRYVAELISDMIYDWFGY
jgi:heat-inducible transcriptional repressor